MSSNWLDWFREPPEVDMTDVDKKVDEINKRTTAAFCKHCDMMKGEHGPDGKCLFDPGTKFEPKDP